MSNGVFDITLIGLHIHNPSSMIRLNIFTPLSHVYLNGTHGLIWSIPALSIKSIGK